MHRLKSFVINLGKLLILVAVFVSTLILFTFFYRNSIIDKIGIVGDQIPEMFPILLIEKDSNGKIVSIEPTYYKYLDALLASGKKYSYIVPEDQIGEINNLLKSISQERTYDGVATVEVVKKSEDVQIIKFSNPLAEKSKREVGYYEATESSFKPFKYDDLVIHVKKRSEGIRLTMFGLVLSAIILLVIYWLVNSYKPKFFRLKHIAAFILCPLSFGFIIAVYQENSLDGLIASIIVILSFYILISGEEPDKKNYS